MNRHTLRAARLGAIGLLMFAAEAQATPITTYTGSISGAWSSPVLSGNLIDGATGAASLLNNTLTAYCNLPGCPAGSAVGGSTNQVSWGTGLAPINSSSVLFHGASFAGVTPGQRFLLGTIDYTNGTSDLNSLILGATLTLDFNVSGSKVVDPLVISVPMVTTSNTGTLAQNADFINFLGPAVSFSGSLNVLEGYTGTADLYGAIIGDPYGALLDVTIDPSSAAGAAFIGNGLPVTVPEPASLALMGIGLAAFVTTRRRRI